MTFTESMDKVAQGFEAFGADPGLVADRPGQILIGDKNYYGREFEAALRDAGVRLLRPAANPASAPLSPTITDALESII